MKIRPKLKRIGDVLFKLWIVGALVLSVSGLATVFKTLPAMVVVFPSWVFISLIIGLCLEFFLLNIPLSIGLFMRRDWARKLWLVVLFLGLSRPWVTYWQYGPFSPMNSMPSLLGLLAGTGLAIAVCLSRPFSRYMNRQGGRKWFWVALMVCIFGAVISRGVTAWWFFTVPKNSVEQVDLPMDSMRNPMPVGWSEAEAYGYVIPVPTSNTNDHRVFEDGSEWHNFMEKTDEKIIHYTLIMKEIPSYRFFPDSSGIKDLKKSYRILYDHSSSLIAQVMRTLEPHFSHVGFRSSEGVDLMFRLWMGDDDGYFIDVGLESGGAYHKLIIHSMVPLTIEDRLLLISRIRKLPVN